MTVRLQPIQDYMDDAIHRVNAISKDDIKAPTKDSRFTKSGSNTNPQNDPNAPADAGVGILPLVVVAGLAFWAMRKR